jgi:hypothetical protein
LFQTGSDCVAQASLKLTILLPWPPEGWDYRLAPHAQPYYREFWTYT